MTTSIFGSAVIRKEDNGLLSGKSQFMADIVLPEMSFMALLDSPYAHAIIKKIDLSQAKIVDGVLDILIGDDIKQYNPLPVLMNPAGSEGHFHQHQWGFPAGQTILAINKVRHVGETVAAVVATSL